MKIFKKQLPLAVVVLILSLGVCEVLVRAIVPVRNVGPAFTVYDPYYGKRLKHNFSATRVTPEFTMRFSTNSLGFRGPEPTPTDQRPILFLGDSFSMGYGVNDGEEFPAVIGSRLKERSSENPISVINAGIGSTGNGRWIKFLKSEGPKHNPSLVVMQVCSNDIDDNWHERFFECTSDNGLNELPVPPAGWMRAVQSWIEAVPGLSYSYIVGLSRQVRCTPTRQDMVADMQSNLGEHAVVSEAVWVADAQRITARILEEAIAICRQHDWSVLALLSDLDDSQRGFYIRLFEAHNVPMVTIPSKEKRPDLYFQIDGHWHSSGHAYVADRILQTLDGRVLSRRDGF